MSGAQASDPPPPAVRFEPLPERVDLLGLVLLLAGLGALVGSAYGAAQGAEPEDAARHVRSFSLLGAGVAVAVFLLVSIVQGLG